MIGSETEEQDNNELIAAAFSGAPSAADANFGSYDDSSQSFFDAARHHHHYSYDYFPVGTSATSLSLNSSEMKGCKGEDYSFPVRLHYLLDVLQQDGLAHLACWQPHGRCFVVHNPDEFSQKVLPLWFRQSRFGSFQRQLNLYGFRRMKTGRDKGGYYHNSFLRGQPQMAHNIRRNKVKKSKLQDDDEPEEPNFYSIPFLPFTYPMAVTAAPTVIVQPFAGPNSHYAPTIVAPPPPPPPPPTTNARHGAASVPAPTPLVAAPVQAPAPTAPATAATAVVYDSNSSLPSLTSIPHFDAEDMPVVPNESAPSFGKQGDIINVPFLQSKLLASPQRQALTQSLTYAYATATTTNNSSKENETAPPPSAAAM